MSARTIIEGFGRRSYPGYWISPDGKLFKLGDYEEHATAQAVLDVDQPREAGWARVLVMPSLYSSPAEILVDAKTLTVSQRKRVLALADRYEATPYLVGETTARKLIEAVYKVRS